MKLTYLVEIEITDNSYVSPEETERANKIKETFDRTIDRLLDQTNLFMEDNWMRRSSSKLLIENKDG